MPPKVYQLLIFQDQKLIYYFDPSNSLPPNYIQLQQSHRIQNTLGVSKSIDALIKQIHSSNQTQFRNFKTRQYQFNQYDTINGLKIILITSLMAEDSGKVQKVMDQIYDTYINYVKKNYLFSVGDVIDIKVFQEKIKIILDGFLKAE